MIPAHPLIPAGPVRLDPVSRDLHGQNAELRELGPVVRVELPGGVPAWSVTSNRVLRALLGDARIAANPSHWRALAQGEVPDGWPLIDFVRVRGMTTADGPDHRRLRGPVSQAFTPRRVAALRPQIERLVDTLLEGIDDALRTAETNAVGGGSGVGGVGGVGGGSGVGGVGGAVAAVDFCALFAYPLPLGVICELLGFPTGQRQHLHDLWVRATASVITPEEKVANSRALFGLLAEFVADRRSIAPGAAPDDLTEALIGATTDDGQVLSEAELVGTLLTLLVAGHGTVTKLLTNAVRALLTYPEQLDLVRTGRRSWSAVIEETLRWDSPLGHFPMRYATEDLTVEGVTIRQGDAIILSYAAVGLDEAAYPRAERFDPGRPAFQHLSFGHGVHFCVGSSLARLEAEIALPALFARFPTLRPGADLDSLPAVPSIISNSVQILPITR